MKNTKYILSLVLGAAMALHLSSCSKGGTEEPRTGIYGQWMQTSGKYDPVYDGETFYFPTGVPCFDDDILEVMEDGTFTLTEGASTCNPGSSDLITAGTFTVNGDEAVVAAFGQVLFRGTFTVDATTLTMVQEFTEDGVTYTDTWVFARQ